MPILLGSDNVVILTDLKDKYASAGAGEFITTGTVSGQLKQPDGTDIGTGTILGGAITMTYYSQIDGVAGQHWIGVVEEDVALTIGQDIDIVVTVTLTSDRVRVFKERHRVMNG